MLGRERTFGSVAGAGADSAGDGDLDLGSILILLFIASRSALPPPLDPPRFCLGWADGIGSGPNAGIDSSTRRR